MIVRAWWHQLNYRLIKTTKIALQVKDQQEAEKKKVTSMEIQATIEVSGTIATYRRDE